MEVNSVHIEKLILQDYKSFSNLELELNGKTTILFGMNGTGKSSILRSINLLYAGIINRLVKNKFKQSIKPEEEDVRFGSSSCKLEIDLRMGIGEIVPYRRTIDKKHGKKLVSLSNPDKVIKSFEQAYGLEEPDHIPVFVNYGTNRLVLDVPLKIRTHHEFDVFSTYQQAIENKIDFRTFFEWFRNQEDYENQKKVELKDFSYEDKALKYTKKAVEAMLEGCSNLRVDRKPRLAMKVDKGRISLNVKQLSDGEKCTLALFGDLARRLIIEIGRASCRERVS